MTEELSIGSLVDRRYQIQQVIGKGGFGRTYLAIDTKQFNHPYVLKEFVPTGDSEFVQQKSREFFQQEAQTLYDLSHPQIPKFHAWLEEAGRLFIVQDYVEGKTYWDLLQVRRSQNLQFTEAEVTQWLQDLLPVLDYIHCRNIVHRDISPDNILLPDGATKPVLIDFGVVKQITNEVKTIMGSSLTPVSLVGKVGYAPYEQLRMGKCSPSSDLYALGVTAVVLLTGQDDPGILMDANLEWQWQSFAVISDRLTAILTKLLADKPQQRYQSAQAVLNDLSTDSPIPTAVLPSKQAQAPVPTVMSQPSPHQPLTTMARTTVIASTHQPASPNAPSLFPKFSGKGKVLALSTLSVLLIGGIMVGTQSSQIPGLCQQLDNCAKDQKAQEDYRQAVDQAIAAQTDVQNAKTRQDLETARDRLKASVDQLSAIPSDTKIYAEAQESLIQTAANLTKAQTRLNQETNTSKLISEAEKTAQTAEQKIKANQTIDAYQTAIEKWQKAIATLKKVPKNSLAISQANTLIQTYQSKIGNADQQISRLSPVAPAAIEPGAIAVEPDYRSEPFTEPAYVAPQPAYIPPEPTYIAPLREEPLWGGENSGGSGQTTRTSPLW
ncbi:MAG: protein kinase [Elainella sp. Prado103]|jgi:serine/threonine-protein kinase|nr:protein kinase [Elainella sp. Prado103]